MKPVWGGESLSFIGVDLGGTKILTIVTDGEGRELSRVRQPTPAGREPVVAAIRATIDGALRAAGVDRPVAIGCGAPGTVDAAAGVLLQPPNLPDCRELPLGRLLGEAYGVPVAVENDANAAALGEWCRGAGRGSRNLLYLTLSTGIGGGIVSDGHLQRGAGGTAGEVGHMIVAPGGPLCGCGNHGCWEQMASGTALGRLGGGTGESVVAAARAGEARALQAVGEVVRYAGIGFLNLIHILGPETVVVGGGLAHAWDLIIGPAAQWALQHAFAAAAAACRFVPAALGDDVGAIGAAVAALHAAGEGGPG